MPNDRARYVGAVSGSEKRRRLAMSVVAEFTVPADAFALSATLGETPEMIVEIERVVAHEDDRVMPYFWIRGGDHAAFEAAIRDDPTTQNVTKLDEYEDTVLYRAEWTQNVESVVYAYIETGATILEATGCADRWELRIRFDDEASVTEFNTYCRRNEVPFELTRLYHPSEPRGAGQYGLSPQQRELLVTALERGFFESPREVTMQELADERGVSHQTISRSLRRGYKNLISNALTVTPPEDGDAT